MMAGRWRNEPDVPARFARKRVAQVAGRQQSRITRAQLRQLGVGASTITDWIAAHYLHPRLPGGYAVGTRRRHGRVCTVRSGGVRGTGRDALARDGRPLDRPDRPGSNPDPRVDAATPGFA